MSHVPQLLGTALDLEGGGGFKLMLGDFFFLLREGTPEPPFTAICIFMFFGIFCLFNGELIVEKQTGN